MFTGYYLTSRDAEVPYINLQPLAYRRDIIAVGEKVCKTNFPSSSFPLPP